MASTATRKEEILEQLAQISAAFASAHEKNPKDKSTRDRYLFAVAAEQAAEKLQPVVLTEIWRFHQELASHNLAAIDGMKAAYGGGLGLEERLSGITLQVLAKNFADHVGKARIEPRLMPYQYRK